VPLAQLDYEPIKILLEFESEAENFRLGACMKEPWTTAFVESVPPDGVFYDVGANVGSYALIAAKRGIQTVAIEPGFNNFGALCRNLLRNEVLATTIPLPVALANRTGLIWLDYQDVRQGGASHVFGSPQPVFFSTHRQKIMTYTLDDLIRTFDLPVPTHIKIDVDGNGNVELAVIEGMAETLKSESLVGLMLEIPLPVEEQIVAALAAHGWAVAERFDTREGQKIQNICYARLERVRVAVEKPVKIGKQAKVAA
jgi:FkbM family methyltransferase